MTDPIIKTINVACNAAKAFDTFVNKTTTWWPLDKNSISAMSGNVAKSVTIDPRVGGKIIEVGHDDTEHVWGTVKEFRPGERLVLNWQLFSDLQIDATVVEVVFTPIDANNTKVELTHSNWQVHGDKAEEMRSGYNNGWVGVFEQAYANACRS